MKKLSFAITMMTLSLIGNAAVFLKADAVGANDGTSWENAFTTFSNAVFAVTSFDEPLYVAAGIYHVDEEIPIAKDLQIIGGFNGTETDFSMPNGEINKVIITGDINNNDYWSKSNVSVNYGKVWDGTQFNEPMPDETVLSWSNYGNTSENTKTCLSIESGSTVEKVILKNLIFTCFIHNAISFNGTTKLVVDSCRFLANGFNKNTYTFYALSAKGETYVTNSFFIGNDRAVRLTSPAGKECTNTVSGCTFRKNAAQYRSASLTIEVCNSLITNSLFEENVQWLDGYYSGGAAAIRFNLADGFIGNVENCTFRSNHMRGTALGVVCLRTNNTRVYFNNCIFQDNTIDESNNDAHNDMPRSAAISCCKTTALRVNNSLFIGNKATVRITSNSPFSWSSCIGMSGSCSASIRNTTFTQNTAVSVADPSIRNAVGTIGFHGNYYCAPSLSLINCALVDNTIEGEYSAEVSVLDQYGNGASKEPHIGLFNTILRNSVVNYNPFYLGNTADFPAYKVMANSIVDHLDISIFATDGKSFERECETGVDPVLREALVSSLGKVSQLSLRSISPFVKSGLPIWEATDGVCYWYDENYPKNPWRSTNNRSSFYASVDGVSLDAPIIPDAFGRERKEGKIALGPLNANSPSTMFMVK